MSIFASLTFWVTFSIALAVLLPVLVLHERSKRNRPRQRLGVQPNEQARLIVTDIGRDGPFNKVTHAYHVTTDPQEFADIFVPSGKKE